MTEAASTHPDRPTAERRRSLLGILAGLAAAAVGVALWYLANEGGEVLAAIVAVAVGAGVGAALVAVAGRGGWLLAIVGVVLIVVANAVGQNFVQRNGLQDGIEELQADWSDLRVTSAGISEDLEGDLDDPPVDTTPEGELSCDLVPQGVTIPPPEILAVLPVGGLLCIKTEDLAVIWEDIPLEKRSQLPKDVRAEVKEILSANADAETKRRLAAKRKEYEASVYDIPDEVVACAPQPDFTQPDAASGLGFPDGVPMFLPAADLFSDERVRGDGLEVDPASPACFVRERAEAHPLEAASWVLAAVAAFVIPFRKRSSSAPAS